MSLRLLHRTAALISIWSAAAAAQRPSHRVINSAEIAAGAWHRLTDVVGALMPGQIASVDGFNVAMTSERLPFAGLSATGSPQWVVRLDGQRMPITVDGMWILDELPVAMVQIDSVSVDEGPSIVDGQPSLLGRIDIYTRKVRAGVSGIADYQHGDESGDPGPYRYTPKATPNVEKLGPFTSGTVGYGGGDSWSIEAAAHYSSLNITDTSISRRFGNFFGDLQSDVNASGGSGLATTSLFDGRQYTLGGRGRFTGLLWVPSRRREESIRAIVTQGGSSGTIDALLLPIRYGVSITSIETRELKSPLDLSIDGGLTTNDGFVEALMPDSSTAVGAGFDWAGASGQHSASPIKSQSAGRIWVDFFRSSSTKHLGAALLVGNDIAGSAEGHDVWQLSQRYSLFGAASLIQRLPTVDGAGYSRPWTPFDPLVPVDSSDVKLGRTTTGELRLDLTDQGYRHVRPTIGVALNAVDGWRLDPRVARSATSALLTTFRAGLEALPPSGVTASVVGEVTAIAKTGNDAMNDAMKSTPTATLRADVAKVFLSDWRLGLSGRFTTATAWPVESIPGEVNDLPALRRVDVSVNKEFWRERMRAQLIVRNLFAADERYHPVGASWNFRTHLAITIALPPYSTSAR